MSIFPSGLTGRSTAVLLVAATAIHFGSMLIYERGQDHLMEPWHQIEIKGRLEAARNVLTRQPPANRAAMAALLSSENFQFSWSPDNAVGGSRPAPIADLHAGPIGTEGVVLLDDLTALSFRLALNIYGGHPSHATLLSMTVMVLGVTMVAALLMRGVVGPLGRLARAVESMEYEAETPLIAEQGPDEVRQVTRAFNSIRLRIRQLLNDRSLALAAVSHDLRTPITRMRLRAGFLSDQEMQTSIDRDLDEMEAMIEATLAYLSGEQAIELPRPIDLPALLTTLIDAETDLGRAATYEGPEHLTVTARPLALKRAFANLIANAVVYGGSARVRLHLTDRCVCVAVEDDGPGIPSEDIKRAFDPFVRLENSRNRRSGGVGLGLTIARQAMTAMGGSLVLENRPSGGLTARVELPTGNTPVATPAV